MKFSVLASGSKGNCTYIETTKNKILVDLGMTNLYIEKKLLDLDIEPENINCIFLTHTHVDHISALKVFIKKHNPKVYLTKKMYNELIQTINLDNYVIIDKDILIDDLEVKVFKTSHDTDDSVGYVFKSEDKELVYITDTGYINVKNHELLKNKDAYIIESNHDVSMLMNNPNYPHHIKIRILSDKGHLSNDDSADYISHFISQKTKNIILIHLSEQNNTEKLALDTLVNKLNNYNGNIIISKQNERTELIEV